MVCSAKLYNQSLPTLSTYHQLIPMSMSYHSYAVGGHGGVMPYKSVFLPTGGIHFWWGQKRTFRKAFLALSRDVGTVRVHRDSTALCRCKSGTGPRPCITSASSSIVVVIAALDYIMCSLSRDNDDAHEDFCATSRRCGRKQQKDDRWRHSSPM